MTKEKIQEFSRRVTSSSKSELVVVTFDIILTYLEDGQNCFEAGDIEGFLFNVKKAKQYVEELMGSLDLDYAISHELMGLYLFVNKSLFQCILKKEPINFPCIQEMTEKLRECFATVALNDKSIPSYEKAQEVYAGFTYSKQAGLNETIVTHNYKG